MVRINDQIEIPDDAIELSAIRAQGAGGQNVNKVATAIHLRFDLNSPALPEAVRQRLLHGGDNRITAEGVGVIKAQNHRTQEQNRAEAVERLRRLILEVVGTQLFGGDRPPEKVSVEFSPAVLQRRLDDDTKEVVNPRDVQYLAAATRIIVGRLTLITPSGETSFPLNRDSHTLGRHRNNDIVITDPTVSSFHARFDRTKEGFAITDLKSRNGTFVNGRKAETSKLKAGDEIRVGTARLVYKVDYTSSVG